jgi:hypothetical protein
VNLKSGEILSDISHGVKPTGDIFPERHDPLPDKAYRESAHLPFRTGHSANARKKNMKMFTNGMIIRSARTPEKPAFVKIFQKGNTIISPTMSNHSKKNMVVPPVCRAFAS